MLSRILVMVLCLAVTGGAVAGKLYRWVDEEGNVHYSDNVPPEHARQARQQLNEQGIIVDSVESAPSPEQLSKAREKARLEAENRKQAEEQARRDQILLNAYMSVEDIERTRDAEIAALQRTVDMTRAARESQRRQLAQLVHRAAERQRAGSPVPDELVEDMGEVRGRIQERADYIEEKRAEQAAIFAEYEQDIARYRELKEGGKEEKEEG